MNQEPIFILGLHKSGTSLLRNLFDGHSELFVIPIETHFFKHNGYWIDYGIRRQLPRKLKNDEVIKNYTEWIKFVNSNADSYSDSDTRGFWDLDSFMKYINKLNNNDIKSQFETYMQAMYYSLFAKDLNNDIRIVEKSVENAEFAIDLKEMYPKAKFIHIIRNPYSNLVSIRKFKSKKVYPFLKPIIESLYNNYYFLEKNKELLKDDYYVIKYEDLVKEPDTKINEIIDFIGLKTEDVLFKPTVNGELWEGNSTSNVKFKGLASDRLNNWISEIEPIEVNIINKLFNYTINQYGYEYLKYNKGLKRSHREGLKNYFKNRLLYKWFL